MQVQVQGGPLPRRSADVSLYSVRIPSKAERYKHSADPSGGGAKAREPSDRAVAHPLKATRAPAERAPKRTPLRGLSRGFAPANREPLVFGKITIQGTALRELRRYQLAVHTMCRYLDSCYFPLAYASIRLEPQGGFASQPGPCCCCK